MVRSIMENILPPQKQKKTTRTSANLARAARAGKDGAILDPLPDVQRETFCLALLTESSVSRAAIKAGYSPASAPQQATRLLHYPDVQRRLAGLLTKIADKRIMRKRDVLVLASKRARASILDVIDLYGLTKEEIDSKMTGHPSACAIKEIKFLPDKDGVMRASDIKMYDSRDAYRDLAEFLGWFEQDKVETSVTTGIVYLPPPVNVAAGFKEVEQTV